MTQCILNFTAESTDERLTPRAGQIVFGRYLRHINEPLILDIDATIIESHKSTAENTYKQFPGFSPIIGHINGGYVVHSEFRSGNIAPADYNLSFVKRCMAQLPKDKRLSYLRADSASYQHALFDYCEANHITYTIGARLDSRVLENIDEITQWEPIQETEGKDHHLKEEVAEFWHTMHESQHAFRLIVIKKSITPMLPGIWEMLSEEEKLTLARERYSVIATNADPDTMPTLFMLFKETLQHNWQRHTIQTIRYKLYHIAGKVIWHARRLVLKVNSEFVEILHAIHKRAMKQAWNILTTLFLLTHSKR